MCSVLKFFFIFISHNKTNPIFSSSLQNSFFYCQNISDFLHTIQKPIFLVFKNKYDIFKPKDFVLFNKHRFDFSLPKTIFFTYTKTYLLFFKPNQKFFLLQDRSEFFSKKEDTLINRLM